MRAQIRPVFTVGRPLALTSMRSTTSPRPPRAFFSAALSTLSGEDALAEAVARLVLVAHRAWSALREQGVDTGALGRLIRRKGLVVPGHLGVRP